MNGRSDCKSGLFFFRILKKLSPHYCNKQKNHYFCTRQNDTTGRFV